MEALQSTIFIELDVNTKKITFLRGDNIVDYDSNTTSVYVRVKYKNLSGNTVYLTPSELEGYEFTLYTIKPATNNINVITSEVTDELKENIYGGVVKFEIPRVCTNRLGIVKCEIHINQGKKMIASSTFVLDVQQSLVTAFNDELLGDKDFPVLKQLILEIQKASNIDDNNRNKITTYSSNKIEDIRENLNLQIEEKASKQEVDIERKRIDNIIALKEGSTTGDAEIIDARIGADGVIYSNLGDSIRTQFNNTTDIINNLVKGIITDEIINKDNSFITYHPETSADEFGYGTFEAYDTYDFIAMKNMELFVTDTNHIPNNYFSISIYDNGVATEDNFINRYRNIDSNLPTNSNRLEIKKGQLIAFTVSEEGWNVTISSVTSMMLLDNVVLNNKHMLDIMDYIGNNYVRYISDNTIDDSSERLEIFLRNNNGYIKYNFAHFIADSANANTWNIYNAVYCNDKFEEIQELTTSGEWECAIKLAGNPDFSGGITHGDELTDSISIFVDGKEINVERLVSLTKFKNLTIIEASKMYDPSEPSTLIAEHGKEYIFTEKLVLNQILKWKISGVQLTNSYLAMFPASKLTVSKMYINNEYKARDISASYGTYTGVTSIASYGDKFNAKFTISKFNTRFPDTLLLTDNDGGAYHKQYFIAADNSSWLEEDEVWETQTIYELNYNDN